MRNFYLCLTLLAALAFAGCSSLHPDKPLPKKLPVASLSADRIVSTQTGLASWYGGRWIGRLTANGEHYRAQDMTAAHKKLPFNTYARVTNLKNGKSCVIRINNRGPYVRSRIIDLSVKAATELDMMKSGVARVRIDVLEHAPAHSTAASLSLPHSTPRKH